jgi:hypothetical protein
MRLNSLSPFPCPTRRRFLGVMGLTGVCAREILRGDDPLGANALADMLSVRFDTEVQMSYSQILDLAENDVVRY